MPSSEFASPATGHEARATASATASPRSIHSLPSPPHSPTPAELSSIPDSPSSLVSDLPISSLSSSLFLSGTSSPGLPPQPPIHEELSSRTLVIPSLNVPQYDPARGDAVGNVKVWVMGAGLHECQAAAEAIIREAPLVSEVGDWIFGGDGIASLRASTLSSGAHQPLPRSMQDSKWNVEAYVADVSPDSRAQLSSMIDSILAAIQTPFVSLDRLLNDSEPSTTTFLPLLTSSTTNLHTAVVYLRSSPSTRHDQTIINELSPYIPVITISLGTPFAPTNHPLSFHQMTPSVESAPAATSTFRPRSLAELRDNLFLNPSTLHHLRTEAAERFLRWRDLNAALRQPDSPTVHPLEMMNNSRELHVPSGSSPSSRPSIERGRGRANSTSSVRSSGIIFSSSQSAPSMPASGARQRAMSSGIGIRSALPEVEEEERGPEWIWNWESRFSRDVREQQQYQYHQQRRAGAGAGSSSIISASASSRASAAPQPPPPLAIPTRRPLASTTSSSTIFELTGASPPSRLPSSILRDHRRRNARSSPPLVHHPSPPSVVDEEGSGAEREEEEEEEGDDPLHLRSVLRLAASVLPALFRRYRFSSTQRSSITITPTGSTTIITSPQRHRRRSSSSSGSERSNGGTGKGGRRRKEKKMSWGMFGLGVSVGVVISICIVGLGVELSQRYALGAEIWPSWVKAGR